MGVNRIPGQPQALSSCHMELGGIAGTLTLVDTSQVFMPSSPDLPGEMRIGLDNASAIAQSKDDSPLAGKAPLVIW